MRSSGSRPSLLVSLLAAWVVSLGGAAGNADAAVYKWVDSSGIAHYTTDRAEVPANLRSQIPDARHSGAGELDRIPPPRGAASRDLLSWIPAPRLRPRPLPAPGSDALAGREGLRAAPAPAPESGANARDELLGAIPAPPGLAGTSLDLGAIPAPRSRRGGVRAITEPPPFTREPSSQAQPAARATDEDAGSRVPEGSANPLPASPPSEDPAPRGALTHSEPAGPSRVGSVDSAPPFDPLFDDPPTSESPEILELERQVQADRDTLKKLLTQVRSSGAPLSADPQLREISERLPLLQAKLAALRAQRER